MGRARGHSRSALGVLRARIISLPPTDYGPTNGAQWVRDHARPNVILDAQKPGGAINVAPGSFNQALLNSSGAGAKFWLLAGTHTLTSGLQPLANQQFWCQNGAIIDGANASGNYLLGDSHAQAWEVHGGTWQRCGNASSGFGSSVSALLMNGTGTNRLIEDATILNNYNIGIHCGSTGLTVRRCTIRGSGRYGIGGGAPGGVTGRLFEYNELDDGNTRHLDTGDDAGGTKFVNAIGDTIRYNWAHGNWGFGLWCDWIAENTTVRENVSEGNTGSGIFIERPNGGNSIYRNYVANNGTPVMDPSLNFYGTNQIFIGSGGAGTVPGQGVDVSFNEIDTIGRAFAFHNHSTYAPSVCKGIDVHHNLMWLRASSLPQGDGRVVGAVDQTASKPLWTEASNIFRSNVYKVADLAFEYWSWGSAGIQSDGKTWAEWQALGFDTAGVRELI